MTNYVADTNKYKLAKPPAWWLRQIYEFDSSLVIIPSREHAYHLLAQRMPYNPLKGKDMEPRIIAPDEAMLRAYGLVNPIKLISVTGAWNWSATDLRPQLAARATWRNGGAVRVADALDQRDADEKAARLKWRHDDLLTPRIRAGARAWQYRTGSRVHNAGPVTTFQSGV